MPILILVADDHSAVRRSVRVMIMNKHRDWQVSEAVDGQDAVGKVSKVSPDVAILDLRLPGMNGFEAAAKIRLLSPATKIILFSNYDVPVSTPEAHVDAFVSKISAAQDLIPTIERVINLTSTAG